MSSKVYLQHSLAPECRCCDLVSMFCFRKGYGLILRPAVSTHSRNREPSRMNCDNRTYETVQVVKSARRSNLSMTTYRVTFGEELREPPLVYL